MLMLSRDTASSCLVLTLVPVLPAFMPLFHGSKDFIANGTFIDGPLIINEPGNSSKHNFHNLTNLVLIPQNVQRRVLGLMY